MRFMEIQFTLDTLPAVAEHLLRRLQERKSSTLALYAGMGMGKTTLTTALLQAMGSTDRVQSPTFSIINEYRLPGGMPVYHMDLYRLESEAEAIQAGVEDLLYSGALCIVEWPQKAAQLLPPHTLFIQITQGPGEARVLQEIPQLPSHEKM